MYKAKSKRRHYTERVVVGVLMTSFVLIATTVLVLLMLGYRFNKVDNTITQGGLVQFRSTPSGAIVTAGTARLANDTPSKITLLPGSYTVSMEKDGYELWQRQAEVRAGQVLWLNSARLVPTDITTTTVASLGRLAQLVPTDSGNTAIALSRSSAPMLTVIDTSGDTVETRDISLPRDSYLSGKKHYFSLATWSPSSESILISHSVDKKREWLVVTPEQNTAEVTPVRIAKQTIKKVVYRPGSTTALYAHTADGALYEVTLSNGTATAERLLDNVETFTFIDSRTLLYTTPAPKKQTQVMYRTLGADRSTPLGTVDSKSTVRVFGHEYYGKYYITTAYDKRAEVVSYQSLPSSTTLAKPEVAARKTLRINAPPRYVSNQAFGRFVVIQQAHTQTVYDIELDTQANVALPRITKQPLRWIDGYNFVVSDGTSIRLSDYDGSNQHEITNASAAFTGFMNSSGEYLYSVAAADDGHVLQRSRLVVD